jgi:hypothetical protein
VIAAAMRGELARLGKSSKGGKEALIDRLNGRVP